ncbi:MAG: hypothetical protein KF721_12300 [Ignavibacteriaceae bacterium]|nr:hypothetical protein [Ignavibacteriaceae bacterium]
MISEIFHLLYYKIKTLLYFQIELNKTSIVKNIASFFVYSFFLLAFYNGTQFAIDVVIVKYRLGLFILHKFIGIGVFIFGMSVAVGNMIVSFSTLYKSAEINFLFSKPISSESLFIVKFLDNFFYSSSTLFVFLIAGLSGYANYFQLPLYFYAWSFFVLIIPYVITFALVGILTLFGFIKIADRFGVRVTIFIIGLLYIIALSLFFKFSSPLVLIERVLPYYPNINIDLSFMFSPYLKYFPNFLLSDALFAFIRNDFHKIIINSSLIILISSFVFTLAVYISNRFYYRSFLKVIELRLTKSTPNRIPLKNIFDKNLWFSSSLSSLIKKEIVLFVREPSQVIHFSVMMILIVLFISGIRSTQVIILKAASPELQTIIYMAILVFILFMLIAFSLRFVFPMMSLEGENFWRIRSAPIDIKKLVFIKMLIALVINLFIGIILIIFSHSILHSILVTQALITFVIFSMTIVPLIFMMGSFFSNMKEKNPIRISSSQGATVSFLVSILYLTTVLGLMYYPINEYFNARFFGKIPMVENIFSRINIVLGVVGLFSVILSYLISVKQFKKDI